MTTVIQTPPAKANSAHVIVAWIIAIVTALYMLPWAVAATRARKNVAAIALIDFFLGWTLVGWIVALVMAFGNDAPQVVVVQTAAPQAAVAYPTAPEAATPQAPEIPDASQQ